MKVIPLSLLLLLQIALTLSYAKAQPINDRPIIGILSQPSLGAYAKLGKSYILADYVKWIEQGGARAAVIHYDTEEAELKDLFSGLNGVLFTGGGQNLVPGTTYFETARKLYNWTIEANKAGEHLPLWGTCMGFQLLCLLTSQDQSVLQLGVFDSEGISMHLNFTDSAKESRMFGYKTTPTNIYNIFANRNVTINLHHDGVDPKEFTSNQALKSFYRLISTNVDAKGKPFGSTMEAYNFPIYAVQWHPERNQFEWDQAEPLEHKDDGIQAMQYLSRFLVQEARQNLRHFSTPESEQKALSYAYQVTYTEDVGTDWRSVQTYFFQ